jgi:hypothetical protein
MKKITFILMAFMASTAFWQVQAQGEIKQADGVFAACTDFQDGDIYTDTGGIALNYQNNESSTIELVAPVGETLTVDFTAFNVEASWDSLTVSGDTGGFNASYDGTTLPPTMTSAAGAGLSFEFDSDSSVNRPGWIANLGISNCPPPPPTSSSTICSADVPLVFSPPLYGTTSVFAESSTNSGDTGDIGTGFGQYQITSVVINVQSDTANQTAYALQGPDGQVVVLGELAGGTDGLDTAADLVFTDSSVNNYSDWTGGAPAADYKAEDGLMNALLAGLDINGDWFLVVYGDGASSTVNSFCINLVYQTGPFPEITCPVDMIVSNTVDLCSAVVNYSIPTTVGGVLTNDNPEACSGCTFPVGDTEVTWTSTNEFGGMSSCSFIITVEDVQLPVAIANVGITVTLDENGQAFLNPSDMLSGSTDNCEVELYLTSNAGFFDCTMLGSTTIQGLVIDTSGNESEEISFDVLVIDDMAPVVTCLGAPGTQTFSQNFNAVPVGSTPPAGWMNEIVVGDWDWKFGSGDMPNSEGFTTPAVIFDDDAAGAGNTNGATLTSPTYDLSAASVESASFSYDYTLDELGAETLIVSAWDGSAWVQIALYDTDVIPPTNSGDNDVSSFTNADFKMRFTYDDGGAWGWAAGIDNVDLTVVSAQAAPYQVTLDDQGFALVDASDLIGNVEDNCVTWTAASAVSGDCDQTNPNDGTFENGFNCSSATDFRVANDIIVESEGVFVVDHITASIFANGGIASVDIIYHADNAGLPGDELFTHTMAPTSQAVIGSNFGIDVNEIQLSVPEYTFFGGQGESTRYWIELSVTDGGATGTVFWVITSSSSIGEPVALFNGGWAFPDPAFDGVMSVKGTCQGSSSFAFDCSTLGIQEVEVFVTDLAGNTSSCVATVEVIDDIAPVITCGPGDGLTTVTEDFESTTGSTPPAGWSNDIVVGDWDWKFGSGTMPNSDAFPTNAAIFDDDAAGAGEVNGATLTSPSYDLSDADSASFSYDYSLDELGAETLIVSAWDGSAWAQIALYDTDVIPPTNSGPMDVSSLMNADFKMRFTYDDGGAWGWAAGIDNVSLTYANPPTTSDIVVELGEDGTATLVAEDYLSEQYDACGIDVLTADRYTYSCEDIGSAITVTVTAVDASGNASVCQGTVVVVDLLPPTFTCPDNQSVMIDPDGTHTVADYWDSIDVTDNCTSVSTTQDPAPGTVLGFGMYDIALTATDEYGNVTTCDFTLDLTILGTQDNELNNAISLYPNPANEQVTISNSSNIALETAMIYDLNGKLVSQINLQNMQSEKVIDVATFATGVYMVYITGEQSSVVKRLIKE